MKRRFRFWPIVLSVLVTGVVALAIAIVIMPDVVRWRRLQQVESSDESTMLQGLTYVYNHADDPSVRAKLIDLLRSTDDQKLRDDIRLVLDRAGVWGPKFGLAWLDEVHERLDAADELPDLRAVIAAAMAQHAWGREMIVYDPAFAEVIKRLLHDDVAVVRYNALRALAAMPTEARRSDWLIERTHDDEPGVARLAWLMLGLETRSGRAGAEAKWPELPALQPMPMPVAKACMWAEAQRTRRGETTSLARQVLESESGDPELKQFALFAAAPDVQIYWPKWIDEAGYDDRATLAEGWRAVRAAAMSNEVAGALALLVQRSAGPGAEQQELADAIGAAAIDRLVAADRDLPAPLLDESGSVRPGYELRTLAWLEAAKPGSLDVQVTEGMPDLIRVATVRAMRGAVMDDLAYAFGSDEPMVRLLAAYVAIDRFDRAACIEMAKQLLGNFYDDERMSGAMLAGLAGMDDATLRRKLEAERNWRVKQHLQLALMMTGQNQSFRSIAPGLLTRADMPRLAVLTAMLHAGEVGALDDLLVPLGSDDGSIRSTLDAERYWLVLKRYLPDTAPRFDVWADAAAQQFQVDLLRTWYLMQRGGLKFDIERRVYVEQAQGKAR